MARNKSWYEIQNAAEEEATIYVYDEISSWGVSAKNFCSDLSGVTAKSIKLKMNSPGGNVFDGVTIHNALKDHPASVNVQIDGLAASIASIIAMAGDKITMAPNAMIMIHKAWSGLYGNSDDLRKMAEVLEKIDGTLVDTYADRTGAGKRNIKKMMEDETWMTAKEAKDLGFCDEISGESAAKACFDLSKYHNAPAEAVDMYAQPKASTERDIEQILRDAGVSNSRAKAAVAAIKGDHRDDGQSAVKAILQAAQEARLISAMRT